ncbi:MAG TPA: c-type cytochrome domain-containing protein, partial [Verrucomicrobiae bacterium]
MMKLLAIRRFSSATLLLAAMTARGEVDFQREVRPILSGICFKCHGPDDATRKGGLRLDIRDEALKPSKSGDVAIVPGDVSKSALVKRIFTTDEDDLMPPPKAKMPLTDAQKDILKRWVAEGAEYRPHWAFVAPKRPELPEVKQKEWPRNEIDYFILARLEKEGLKPSEQADKYSLVRRVYLDLIG